MQELLQYLVDSLAGSENTVKIEYDGDSAKVMASKNDIGKLIGKQGRTAKAIRAVLKAVGAREGKQYTVDIVEV